MTDILAGSARTSRRSWRAWPKRDVGPRSSKDVRPCPGEQLDDRRYLYESIEESSFESERESHGPGSKQSGIRHAQATTHGLRGGLLGERD